MYLCRSYPYSKPIQAIDWSAKRRLLRKSELGETPQERSDEEAHPRKAKSSTEINSGDEWS